ncbi:MAG: MlaD family protein [Candidatus Dactylopiibacterium sp.]|nr:MlaD family protein [Candidatus Dactylopiibacterium sp.]
MNDTPPADTPDAPAAPHVKRSRTSLSLVWIVPIVAALVGLSMLVNHWLSAGPRIAITFESAAGLEAGKTPVKYKDVVIGRVSGIALDADRARVRVSVELNKDAASFATRDARFWVVRPRIGVGGISGIDTVLSGAYIGVDSGESTESASEFTGLEIPPSVIHGTPGKSFQLRADDLGSLDIGSPVYYRRIPVGQVTSYQLAPDGSGVTLQVFVFAPHDGFVKTTTRFWNASGLDLSLSAEGLQLNTESVATVLAGGIAFTTPEGDTAPAASDARFELFRDQKSALAKPDGAPQFLRMRFDQSLRGLSENAPVEFFGINIGQVRSVNVDYDRERQRFPVIVDAVIYPERLGRIRDKADLSHEATPAGTAQFISGLVARGLRAQARTGNLITGQLYIAIDFIPNTPAVAFDPQARPLVMPTVRSSLDDIQQQLAGIVAKIDKIPFDSIGQKLDTGLDGLGRTMRELNEGVLPEAREAIKDARGAIGDARGTFGALNESLAEGGPLQQNLRRTLQEFERSAFSLRMLTEQLNRHPESLLRGRREGDVPPPAPATPARAAPRLVQEPAP